ncbi:hypothetical protein YC2023_077120 [Brassica napus]
MSCKRLSTSQTYFVKHQSHSSLVNLVASVIRKANYNTSVPTAKSRIILKTLTHTARKQDSETFFSQLACEWWKKKN